MWPTYGQNFRAFFIVYIQKNLYNYTNLNIKGDQIMKKPIVITLTNHKGGVGKTTISCNLSASVSRLKRRSGARYHGLLIDFDPQGNTSDTMLKEGVNPNDTISELFRYGGSVDRGIYPTKSKFLDIMPCDLRLFMMEDFLRESGQFMDLKTIIDTNNAVFGKYDYIVIDSPPNLGPFMLNAISASDYYMVPIEAGSIYSLTGLHTLEQVIENHLKQYGINSKLLGYVLNRYDGRTIASKEMMSQARHFYKNLLFDTVIRDNTTVKRAQGCKKTVHQLQPNSFGAIDFDALAKEFIQRLKLDV